VFVPPLPLDIDESKLKITAANDTADRHMFQRYGMSWIKDWAVVESRMKLTLSIVRARKSVGIFLFMWH
jgi:hypothetical protein